jgi:DNA-directed RNA polymerase subunit RPC12/RpoP
MESDIMGYKCGKCGKSVSTIEEGLVRCPSCGHRVIYKTRESVAKIVKVD